MLYFECTDLILQYLLSYVLFILNIIYSLLIHTAIVVVVELRGYAAACVTKSSDVKFNFTCIVSNNMHHFTFY